MNAANLDPRDPSARPEIESLLTSGAGIEPETESLVRRVATEAAEPMLRAHAKVVLASNVIRQGRVPEAETLYQEGLTVLRGSNSDAELRGCVNYALACLNRRRVLEAMILSHRAIAISKYRRDSFGLALARSHLAGSLFNLGEFRSAYDVLDALEADLDHVPAPRRAVVGRLAAAYRLTLAVDLEDASAAHEAIARLETFGPMADPRSEPWMRALGHFASKRYGAALAAIEEAQAQPFTGNDHAHSFRLFEIRCLFASDAPTAEAAARAALEQIDAARANGLSAGRRLRLAERLSLLLRENEAASEHVTRAFDIAGAAALDRLGEVEYFLTELPAFVGVEDAELQHIMRLRERLTREHRALLSAAGMKPFEAAGAEPPQSGTLCACAWCHAVRGPDGVWLPADRVPTPAEGTPVTHGMCIACRGRYARDQRDGTAGEE